MVRLWTVLAALAACCAAAAAQPVVGAIPQSAMGQLAGPARQSDLLAETLRGTTADVIARHFDSYSNVVPSVHLAKSMASAAPVICLAGDSKSTLADSQINQTDLIYQHLVAAFRRQNPTKPITFVNRAIGAQTWTTFNNLPTSGTGPYPVSSFPAWYTNPNTPWLSYVQSAGCTSLFLAFGINDATTENQATIKAVLGKIAAWPSVPDIVLITNEPFNPSYNYPAGTAPMASIYTAGVLFAQSYVRTLALSGGAFLGIANLPPLGLIDVGRYMDQAALGLDPADQIMSQAVPTGTSYTLTNNGSLSLATTQGDFDILGTISGHAADLISASGSTLLFQTGAYTTAGTLATASYIQVLEVSGTFYAYVNDGASQVACPVTVPAGTGDLAFEITAKNDRIMFTMQGVLMCDMSAPRFVAPFAPVIQYTGSSVASATLVVTAYETSKPQVYVPIVSNLACWGNVETTTLLGLGNNAGGDGYNHDAAPCTAMSKRALDRTNLSLDPGLFGGGYSLATPTPTAQTGTLGANATSAVRYKRDSGFTVAFNAQINIPAAGSASGVASLTMPFTVRSGVTCFATGREVASNGKHIDMILVGSAASLTYYDGSAVLPPTPTTAQLIFVVNGLCETAS